jgi:hypothetical protein
VWKYDGVFVTPYTHTSHRSQYSNAAGGANFIGPMTNNHGVEGLIPSALTNDRNDEFAIFVLEIQTENSRQHTASTLHAWR